MTQKEKKAPKRKMHKMVSVRLDPEMFDAAQKAAKARGMSLSEFIRYAALKRVSVPSCADCHAYGLHADLSYAVVQGTTVCWSGAPHGCTSGLEPSFMGWLCRECGLKRYGSWAA